MEPRDDWVARRTTFDAESSNIAGDRITGLPQHIIHHIFSCLKSIDVIRACVVCRKWRYLWTSTPFFYINEYALSYSTKSRYFSTTERFIDFVNWVLLMHDGSTSIEKFHLRCKALVNNELVNRWIRVLVRRNVKELDLALESQFEFPFSLLTCESLVGFELDLSGRPLMLPTITGFSRLKSLKLESVKLTDETLTQQFITAFPVLESFKMIQCDFYFKVLGIFSTTLKHLTIGNVGHPRDDRNLSTCQLNVACPNLVSFNYKGKPLLEYTFQGILSVQNASMDITCPSSVLTKKECGLVLLNAFKGLSNAKAWMLSPLCFAFLDTALSASVPPCTSFLNLKTLKLVLCQCYIKPIISLLNCFPNLEALVIHFDEISRLSTRCNECCGCELIREGGVRDEPITCLTCYLKMVELMNVEGRESELELIRFLLKHGKVLQKMNITWLKDPCYIWPKKKDAYEGFMQEVMEFQRSSSDVVIRHLHIRPLVDFIP